MQWFSLIIVVAALALFLLPRLKWIGVEEAAQHLKAGALLVDVRSLGEVKSAPVAGARHVPLGRLVHDFADPGGKTEQVVLVFCASGVRSGSAVRQLKALGYTRVWNLGGLGRARQAAQRSLAGA